jgi:sec-independent protein translocase protein TatA
MDFGWPELLVILVLVILLFGPGRIGKVASEIGSGIRGFREGLAGDKKVKEEKAQESSTNTEEKK